jgi:hypothetical protein
LKKILKRYGGKFFRAMRKAQSSPHQALQP